MFHNKLKRLKADLSIFNQTHFGGTLKVTEKKTKLAAMQVSILSSSASLDLIKLEKSFSFELHDLLLVEESFFKQKSRINWINEGDQNTKLFFKSLSQLIKTVILFEL